jgi:glycosyltransferase involved in cell wall biosynthesis
MSGCIVVGTNVGGISDIIEDGETGFLVPEKDPKTIAKTLVSILQAPSKINTLKHHVRERMIQKFDWQSIADRYARILNDNAQQ